MDELEECYKALGVAIVRMALIDWQDSVKKLQHSPDNVFKQAQKEQCERFFYSPTFEILCGVDAETLLRGLKERMKKDKKFRITRPNGKG